MNTARVVWVVLGVSTAVSTYAASTYHRQLVTCRKAYANQGERLTRCASHRDDLKSLISESNEEYKAIREELRTIESKIVEIDSKADSRAVGQHTNSPVPVAKRNAR